MNSNGRNWTLQNSAQGTSSVSGIRYRRLQIDSTISKSIDIPQSAVRQSNDVSNDETPVPGQHSGDIGSIGGRYVVSDDSSLCNRHGLTSGNKADAESQEDENGESLRGKPAFVNTVGDTFNTDREENDWNLENTPRVDEQRHIDLTSRKVSDLGAGCSDLLHEDSSCHESQKELSECGMLFAEAERGHSSSTMCSSSSSEELCLDYQRMCLNEQVNKSTAFDTIPPRTRVDSKGFLDRTSYPSNARARTYIRAFVGYVEGDDGGRATTEQLESHGVMCLDYYRDSSSGPEKSQIEKMMTSSEWIVLYISDLKCSNFDFIKLMATEIAKESKKSKIVCVVACRKMKLPCYLRIFPKIRKQDHEDWLGELIALLSTVPQNLKPKCCWLHRSKTRK